jgi:hypothetical protein
MSAEIAARSNERKSLYDGESRHGAMHKATVDLAFHLATLGAVNAENQKLKASYSNSLEEISALQVKLAVANADKSEALDDAALWHGRFLSSGSKGIVDEKDDKGKADKERAERQRLTTWLLDLYGERPNAEVVIAASQNSDGVVVNAVVEFDRLAFAYPRLTNDGEFIQVFSRGCNYRLEFPTTPQSGEVTLILEKCPKMQIENDAEFDEFCESSWNFVTTTRIRQRKTASSLDSGCS